MAQILVVDDSATVRNEVSAFLAANDLSVEVAVDGKDGLEKLQRDSQIKLVISDVNMPNMDGLTMAEKVRGDLGNQAVNIIMLTTESDPRMKQRGKAAGVKGWIVKPFKGDNVVGSIKKMVGAA
jgi:two-component system chemotaxis response regulator CheY